MAFGLFGGGKTLVETEGQTMIEAWASGAGEIRGPILALEIDQGR